MALIQTPHEFLVRWDDAGTLKGAHIVYREAFTDENGADLFSKFGEPRSVALTDTALLGAISAEINTAALSDNAAKDAALKVATDAQAAAESARDASRAEVAKLQAQITALQPPAIDGIPQEVTMRQAQLALLGTKLADGSSLLDRVDMAIAAMTGEAGRAAQITWSKSADVLRSNPLISQLQGALGLTDAQIDALFVAAAKL